MSRALRDALATWAAFLALLLVAGLATGVWWPSDVELSAALTDIGPLYGLLSLGLVALPVYVLRRYGFRAPAALLVGWLALGFAFGLTLGFQPVRGLYVAVLYGFLPTAAYPLLAGLEFVFGRLRGSEPARTV
jgi:hypothetical protein